MLAVASLKRTLEFDPVEQGAKRKRAEMKLPPPSPPSSPVSGSASSNFSMNASPSSPSKQQQQPSIFTSSPSSSSPRKSSTLVVRKPCSLTALNSAATTNDEIPMFNYAQTAQICARLLREQDRSIREQYEQLLTTKLSEQYDTFIRYTNDSVYRDRPRQEPSIRLFNFTQNQETKSTTSSFSYVS